MSSPECLTIDVTVARDFLEPDREGRAHAAELFELARRGEVELATAPQGFRFDVDGDLAQRLREAFEREEVGQTCQVARVSEVTYPGADLFPGHYVEGFVEVWDEVVKSWRSHEWKPPGPADASTSRRTSSRDETSSSPTTGRCV